MALRPIKLSSLVHEVKYYRPRDKTKEQTIKRVKVDRASSVDMAMFGSSITGSSKYDSMILIVDRVNSIYEHMDLREQDQIEFKGETYSVVGVIEQTADKTDEVHHWEVLLA